MVQGTAEVDAETATSSPSTRMESTYCLAAASIRLANSAVIPLELIEVQTGLIIG